ncbi:hypothetical protein PRIPAC_81043 [Pristionchus pacificus]|uniref:Uncharacterized protein n=1 Tax=Pristionchus pacificus TaxID=54126 RepID=A0A2A6BXE9_PRIPA|nr:hypothetical protein PRIPAC_81043 [Pristionchus pacificus]|eukprot:PDM70431.1 hypothetical protein PRIPAC_46677 [Pristionchus pacificus]
MPPTSSLIVTRVLLALVLFVETIGYAYVTFCGHLLRSSSIETGVKTPRPLFYYCCTALAGSALAAAMSISCCCLDRSRSERAVNGLVYSFLAALTLLALSQFVILIVLVTFEDYRSMRRFLAILALLLLSIAAIVMVSLQHHFTVQRIRGYHLPSSSSSSGRGTGAVPSIGPGGTASPPTNGVYEQMQEQQNGGAHNLNMFDYYQVPDDSCCKTAKLSQQRHAEQSVEV